MKIIDFQNKRWNVKHKRPDENVSAEALDFYKWYHRADMVLKKNGILIFVEEIPEADFEDIIEKN